MASPDQELSVMKVIESVSKPPSTPQILPKLQSLLRDENSSLMEISRLIKLDPGLTAQVVRIANSAFFGVAQPASGIDAAVNRIGFSEVYKLVGAVVARHVLGDRLPLYNIETGDLWRLSVCCAHIMHRLSKWCDFDAESAYTCGLLHSLGKVVINEYFTTQDLKGEMAGIRALHPDEELQVLGFTNADVAARLLEDWKFLPEVVIPVRYLLNPYVAPQEYQAISVILYFAVEVSMHMLEDPEHIYENFDPDTEHISWIGVTVDDFIDAGRESMHIVDTFRQSIGQS